MALETGNHISNLVAANPESRDPLHEIDDHLRLIKKVLKNCFPGLSSALLNAAGRVLPAKMGTGTANNTTVLHGDGAWREVKTMNRVAVGISADVALTHQAWTTIMTAPVISPGGSASKFIVDAYILLNQDGDEPDLADAAVRIRRGSTVVYEGAEFGTRESSGTEPRRVRWVDSPNSASNQTYQVQIFAGASNLNADDGCNMIVEEV